MHVNHHHTDRPGLSPLTVIQIVVGIALLVVALVQLWTR